MAGSYSHVTKNHKLAKPLRALSMLEASGCGDVYEALEEMYGMIWYLAIGADDPQALVEEARQHYEEGLNFSPTKRYKENPSSD